MYFIQDTEKFGITNSKTIGIIGGLGPETTSKFYLNLISKFLELHEHRPSILIANVPVSLKLEKQLIEEGKGRELFSKLLSASARKLETGGADFIVIPCNTVHMFIDEIRTSVKIPVLSIVEESAKFLRSKNITDVCIFSTGGSNSGNIFDKIFEIKRINIRKLNKEKQKLMNEVIMRILSSENTKNDKKSIRDMIKDSNIPVLLACTDLQHIVQHDGKRVFDTLEILAEATIKFMHKK